MRTAGIDLAAQPENTALASLDWDGDAVSVAGAATGVGDDAILETVASPDVDVTGIDVPLGWPRAFAEFVAAHSDGRPLPHGDRGWPGLYDALRMRATDRWLRDHLDVGPTPMSVSTDKLGAPALRAARVLDELSASAPELEPIDRSGTSGPVAEIYPAAALACWGLPHRGYKRGSGAAAVRAEIVDGLEELVDGIRGAVDDDHQLDAVVGALVAGLARRNGTVPIPSDHRETAAREGWIHIPQHDAVPGGGATP